MMGNDVCAVEAFHRYQDSIEWRLTRDGVELKVSGLERTKGRPATVTRVWERYASEINRSAAQYRVPSAVILANICTESAGNASAVRREPGYKSDEKTPHKVSAGLMQTLLSTARNAMEMSFDLNWLLDAQNSIDAGTAYIAQQRPKTSFDPPLIAAAYNAGGVYYQPGILNRWKTRQYPIGTSAHVDRWVRLFNDAVFVLRDHATAPRVGLDVVLR